MKVSAILVNYHVAEPLVAAVRSILAQPSADETEIIVVDNSESDDEFDRLEDLLAGTAILLRNTRNTGFAAACNTAFARASGDAILLLNPDARLLPGALASLKRTLFASRRVGAVGPLAFWDEACRFMLPPSTFPSVRNHLARAFSRLHPQLAMRYSLQFRSKALELWNSHRPVHVQALSGGHVLLKREAIERAGGLFDEAFFMYWEDSDLMQRLQHAGYRLLVDPAARALHLYDHHPGKDALMARGWAPYYTRHLRGKWRTRLAGLFERHARPLPSPPPGIGTLPGQPIVVAVPPHLRGGWLLEISPAPDFVPAMGRIGKGDTADIPPPMLAALYPRALLYPARTGCCENRPATAIVPILDG